MNRFSLLALTIPLNLTFACGSGGSDKPSHTARGDAGTQDESDAGASTPSLSVGELPEGSREHSGVVNIVDGEAAAQLEAFFHSTGQVAPGSTARLAKPVNRFLSAYRDEYDFLYLLPDHTIEDSSLAGKFEPINQPAQRGTGIDWELRAPGYLSTGRLKGAAAIQYAEGFYGPFQHEAMHYWGNYLDPSFGIGAQRGIPYDVHWGFSDVHGTLGGFERASLRCSEPASALPPDCTPLENGRIRYVAGIFGAGGNGSAPYAPLELYLMGLIPPSEVPTELWLLEDAEFVPDSTDEEALTLQVEASGLKTLAFADVVARHGKVPLRGKDERNFRAAFVVVSNEPASDAVLDEVAGWARAFGGRAPEETVFQSFEQFTGGRATMDTTLGKRRSKSDELPAESVVLTCDVFAQDCPRELGCYGLGPSSCAFAGKAKTGDSCLSYQDCAPGLDCMTNPADETQGVCEPYCVLDASTDEGCDKLCGPGNYLRVQNADKVDLGALCLP